MTNELIWNDQHENYFEYLRSFTVDENHVDYIELLRELYATPFYWKLRNDENRANDGVNLRYRYEDETGHDISNLYGMQCSMLEFLVALAYRIENDIMWDPDEGNRTSYWFWLMVKNLGLEGMRDGVFGPDSSMGIRHNCDVFMSREYWRDGFGGIFPLKYSNVDQKRVEIWYQMHSYLQENYPI